MAQKKRKGYTEVPNALIESERLSPADKLVWVILQSHNFINHDTRERKGFVCPSYKTIAREACISRRQAVRSVRNLEGWRLVKCSEQKVKGKKSYRSNSYDILPFEESEIATEAAP